MVIKIQFPDIKCRDTEVWRILRQLSEEIYKGNHPTELKDTSAAETIVGTVEYDGAPDVTGGWKNKATKIVAAYLDNDFSLSRSVAEIVASDKTIAGVADKIKRLTDTADAMPDDLLEEITQTAIDTIDYREIARHAMERHGK